MRVVQDVRAIALELARSRGVHPVDAVAALGELSTNICVQLHSPNTRANRAREQDLEAAVQLVTEVDTVVAETLRASHAFVEGTVFCFLCDSSSCRHSRPNDAKSVFAGYTPLGRPTWRDFVELCIDEASDRVGDLYAAKADVVALAQTSEDLKGELLPAFGRESIAYQVHAQVVAGLIPVDFRPQSTGERRAVTIQVIETLQGATTRRLRLNFIGITRDEVLNAASDGGPRGPAERLRKLLRQSTARVNELGRKASASKRKGQSFDVSTTAHRIARELRGELDALFRGNHRRTKHASERHQGESRPTEHAARDAKRVREDQLLYDTKRDTFVVLGAKGRAHVFSPNGKKHVTSLRLGPNELDRKMGSRRWRLASAEEFGAFQSGQSDVSRRDQEGSAPSG